MKTLRVCHSEDLPSIHDRDINYIYYLYDKLEVFLGQNYYSDPYAIVETYPGDNVVAGMLYFCLDDGYVRAQVNLETTEIAKIESDEQLEILKQAGTKFFVNADRRYLDVKTKLITLPFRNGTYELTVSLANDLKIDENTVIGYNPETQEFEIIGDIQDFDLVFSRRYKGVETNTIKTNVEDHKISSDVKLNPAYDNIIKETPRGLYASVDDRVTSTVFKNWIDKFMEYKDDMEIFILELADLIEKAEEIISSDTISRKILESLQQVYPEIDSYLENYNQYAQEIDDFETEIHDYADQRFTSALADVQDQIDHATNDPWEIFETSEPESESDTESELESEDDPENTDDPIEEEDFGELEEPEENIPGESETEEEISQESEDEEPIDDNE